MEADMARVGSLEESCDSLEQSSRDFVRQVDSLAVAIGRLEEALGARDRPEPTPVSPAPSPTRRHRPPPSLAVPTSSRSPCVTPLGSPARRSPLRSPKPGPPERVDTSSWSGAEVIVEDKGKNGRATARDLPDDFMLMVFCQLDAPALVHGVSAVCKAWHHLASNEKVWQKMYFKRYGGYPPVQSCGTEAFASTSWRGFYRDRLLASQEEVRSLAAAALESLGQVRREDIARLVSAPHPDVATQCTLQAVAVLSGSADASWAGCGALFGSPKSAVWARLEARTRASPPADPRLLRRAGAYLSTDGAAAGDARAVSESLYVLHRWVTAVAELDARVRKQESDRRRSSSLDISSLGPLA